MARPYSRASVTGQTRGKHAVAATV